MLMCSGTRGEEGSVVVARGQCNLFLFLQSDLAIADGPICSIIVVVAEFEAEVPMCLVVDEVLFPLG